MISDLAKSLIIKNVIKENTELEVIVSKDGLSSTINVKELVTVNKIVNDKNLIFRCSSTVDGQKFNIRAKQILNIDGMNPSRLASIYNISPKGNFITPGKKRGRRPKNYVKVHA